MALKHHERELLAIALYESDARAYTEIHGTVSKSWTNCDRLTRIWWRAAANRYAEGDI